jgi:3-hydroxyacyl-CoA dehydrogenase
MSISQLDNLTVLGAGILGGQIAWHSAFKGKSVVIYDLYDKGLEQCRLAHENYAAIYQQDMDATEEDVAQTRGRISFSTDLPAAVAKADIVIEAVPEIPDVKIKLYQQLAACLPEHTLLATNSSTLLPSQFAETTGRPDKFCALHFANLIWQLNVCEVMGHTGVAEQTLVGITQFAIEIGMVPIPIQKEQNAYVMNSMLIPLLQAAQALITTGVSSPEDVDRTFMIMNRGCGSGPCGTIDIVGMQTFYNILSYWGTENNDQKMLANAQYIKENFIDKGKLGMQSGEGYYSYPNPAYQAADFLDVPDISKAKELAKMAVLE